MAAFFLSHFWHYNYLPGSGPWYGGAVWPNVFVIAVIAPLGWLWSRTRFWPPRSLHRAISALHDRHDKHSAHLDRLGKSLIEVHEKLDRLEKP